MNANGNVSEEKWAPAPFFGIITLLSQTSLPMQQPYQDKFFILAILFVALYCFYLLAPILTPFFAAALLAYLANPLVNRLVSSLHLPRLLSVIIVFLLLFAFIIVTCLLLFPFLQKQLDSLIQTLPSLIDRFNTTIMPSLTQNFGLTKESFGFDSMKTLIMDNWSKAGGWVHWLFKTTLYSGYRFFEWVVTLLIIPVVTFYLLCDWHKFITGIRNLLPRRIEPTVVKLTKECDDVISAFFRGQLLVMLALAIMYSIGLTLVGLSTGVLIGMVSGILSIVPYLGFIIGITSAMIAAYVQFGTVSSILLVIAVFLVGQTIADTLLTPKLVGNRIGLHPVAVIFAVLAGGSLFGFLGVLLALPTAAMIMVWLRYLNQRYHHSKLYQD